MKNFTSIKINAFPEAYHALIRVNRTRDEIPSDLFALAVDMQEELYRRNYPALIVLRPVAQLP